jgi:hypothetical protein
MDTAVIISALKDIVLGGAAIVTATVAVKGLRRWRDELRGKVDFEVARNLIRATYKLRDELQSARSPMIRGSEFPGTYTPNDNSAEKEAEAWAHVYSNRWRPVLDAVREFEAQALEAEALWGSQVRDATNELRRSAHQLYIAMEAYIDDKRQRGENFRTDREFGKKINAELSASSSAKDNALSQRIEAAVAAIESKVKAHLSRG